MLIGSDLDNVIVNILESARTVIARDLGLPVEEILDTHKYGNPFSHADPDIAKLINLDHVFWNREDVLFESHPIEGSLDALWRLHDADILACYITRRAPHVSDLTRQWLQAHGYPPVPVEHVGTLSTDTYYATSKSSVCARYNVTHMIDDHALEAESLMRAGIEVILVDAPIAKAERHAFIAKHPHIRMVATAADAVDLLLRQKAA